MAYNEKIADRIREALVHIPKVEEKRMFRGVTFMVNDKMCISVGADRIMCRFDPAMHDEIVEKPGVHAVIMGGREYKGYVHVFEDQIKSKKDLDFWIKLCLDYNPIAKAAPKKKKISPIKKKAVPKKKK